MQPYVMFRVQGQGASHVYGLWFHDEVRGREDPGRPTDLCKMERQGIYSILERLGHRSKATTEATMAPPPLQSNATMSEALLHALRPRVRSDEPGVPDQSMAAVPEAQQAVAPAEAEKPVERRQDLLTPEMVLGNRFRGKAVDAVDDEALLKALQSLDVGHPFLMAWKS
eukprot:scaffold748_cov251-Pinguiococcus_pyrenoidosus.AAC.7